MSLQFHGSMWVDLPKASPTDLRLQRDPMRRHRQRTDTMRRDHFVKLLAVALSTAAIIPQISLSDPVSLVCESPKREYRVEFDADLRSVSANDTQYSVLAVEETAERTAVVGLTTDGGPTYRLYLHPYKKMEFFSDGKLFQTDNCR